MKSQEKSGKRELSATGHCKNRDERKYDKLENLGRAVKMENKVFVSSVSKRAAKSKLLDVVQYLEYFEGHCV